MKTRDMGYDDYGLLNGDEKQVSEWAKRLHSTTERQEIYNIALDVKACIADELVYSLMHGISYDNLFKISNITYSKNVFYGYRRQFISRLHQRFFQ